MPVVGVGVVSRVLDVRLAFHHVEPRTKSFSMHMGVGKALATFREEARKCVLVCANCHGEIEAGLIPSPPAGARWNGSTSYPQRDSNPRSPP
jgi:cytochrome c553